MSSKAVYNSIKAEMARKGLTNKEMADILKISYVNIGRKINGRVQWKINEIDFLCKFFNMSYEELFKKEG